MLKRHLPLFVGYSIALLLSLVALAVGITLAARFHEWSMLAAAVVSLVFLVASGPIVWTWVTSRAYNCTVDEMAQPLVERVEQLGILLNLMSEQQLLSDRAKAVAFREKDRDALRRAIQEEMAKQDWEAAFALADDVERAFGYRAEAERLRGEIRHRKGESVRKQIAEVMTVIDRHTRSEQWAAAIQEADRLAVMFPDNEQVKNLPHEIDNRRSAHKRQLLQSWNEAVARHDVDGSIEILKQLDTYLSPQEAEGMQETVRGVFKEKLNNLGAQFSTAVRDHKWVEAIRVGDGIVRDFPNTRIAQEVREKMDLLRQRAAGVEPVANATAAPVNA